MKHQLDRILSAPQVPMASTLLGVADRLEAILNGMAGSGENKEFDVVGEMLKDVRRSLGSETQQQGELVKPAGGLVIDRSRFVVAYKGKTCELGNTKAFQLLERLHRSPGIYIHYDTLKQDVWGNSDINEETLQRQASTLRCQLQKAGIGGIVIDGRQRHHYRLVLC